MRNNAPLNALLETHISGEVGRVEVRDGKLMITRAGSVVVTTESSVLFPSSGPEHLGLNDDIEKV